MKTYGYSIKRKNLTSKFDIRNKETSDVNFSHSTAMILINVHGAAKMPI